MATNGLPTRFTYELNDWPAVDFDHYSGEELNKIKNRIAAIRALHSGMSYRKVRADFGIAAKELNRYIARCQMLHDDGRIWGFRILVDRQYVNPSVRKTKPNRAQLNIGRGARSLFQQLLSQHPELDALVDQQAKAVRVSMKKSKRIGYQRLHGEFIDLCRKIFDGDPKVYPLSLTRRGFDGYYDALTKRVNAIESFAGFSNISRVHSQRQQPYSDIEIDAHKLDCQLTVRFPTPLDGLVTVPLNRLNLIVARDRESDSNLAKLLVINREIRACPRFCVNGLLAGNCLATRSSDDRREEARCIARAVG